MHANIRCINCKSDSGPQLVNAACVNRLNKYRRSTNMRTRITVNIFSCIKQNRTRLTRNVKIFEAHTKMPLYASNFTLPFNIYETHITIFRASKVSRLSVRLSVTVLDETFFLQRPLKESYSDTFDNGLRVMPGIIHVIRSARLQYPRAEAR